MGQHIRVTFCAYEKPGNLGGPVTWLMDLVPALRERGIESTCLFLMHRGDSGPALDSLRERGFVCHTFAGVDTEQRARWILERLREEPPDVFIPNFVVSGLYAGASVRRAGIPTVMVLHSDDDFYRALQDSFIRDESPFRASVAVCVSREIAGQAGAFGAEDVDVEYIPYGVSIPPSSRERPGSTLRIAYVGRLAEEQKRVSDVAKALAAVTRSVPGTEAVMYGDGPDRDLVERILSAEAADVELVGGRLPEEIHAALRQCDVITLFSDYEGLPIALLEGMAAGCVPIVRHTRSGIPELVEDGINGIIVEDQDAFISAVARLRSDANLLNSLSRAAVATVADGFSSERCADSWAALLRRLALEAGDASVISMPRSLSLPPRNPAFGGGDVRVESPTFVRRLLNYRHVALERIAGAFRSLA